MRERAPIEATDLKPPSRPHGWRGILGVRKLRIVDRLNVQGNITAGRKLREPFNLDMVAFPKGLRIIVSER